jgi:D-sedoheptulose 7-phosphate isomerase
LSSKSSDLMMAALNPSSKARGAKAVFDDFLARRPDLAACRSSVDTAFLWMADAHRNGRKLLLCGNGGSAADAGHWMGELVKGFGLPRRVSAEDAAWFLERSPADLGRPLAEKLQRGFRAIDLTAFGSSLTAVSNDNGADLIFAQLVFALGQAGDVLVGISTSGNSRNVLAALTVGRRLGIKGIALTGPGGGKAAGIADLVIAAPGGDTPAIQEAHLPIYHTLCLMLEEEFFGGT